MPISVVEACCYAWESCPLYSKPAVGYGTRSGELCLIVCSAQRPDAEAFCAAEGKRLPHSWEWQYAAQGLDKRPYPWGETWDGPYSSCNRILIRLDRLAIILLLY